MAFSAPATAPATAAGNSAAPASDSARIALIHATALAMAPVDEALDRLWPSARRMHLLDASLSADLAREGKLTPAMIERFVTLGRYVSSTGVKAILFTCSAFGPAIEQTRRHVGLPPFKPNQAMFELALASGNRVGLVATFAPSLPPMREEFRTMAEQAGVDVPLHECFVPEAMAALGRGDAHTHHRLVAEAVAGLPQCDVIMLAQFSMAAAATQARQHSAATILTSPDCAVDALRSAVHTSASL